MVFIRSAALTVPLLVGIALAAPLKAQTTATLTVSVRVVEECTATSKRELVRLARKLNDPGLIRRCSKGVVSRVNQRVVKVANIQPSAPGFGASNRQVSKKRVLRSTINGAADVVLVTVTY